MNILLIFFAIPLAIIILSAILETFINCPLKVAGIFFAIFIVVAFALGGTAELIVLAIIYTIIAFITAVIVRFIINRKCNRCNDCDNGTCNNCNNNTCNNCNNLNNFSLNNELNNALNNGLNNNFNNIPFNFNNNAATVNSLPEQTSFNSNNTNSTCRRFR